MTDILRFPPRIIRQSGALDDVIEEAVGAPMLAAYSFGSDLYQAAELSLGATNYVAYFWIDEGMR